ncbi:MAG: ABC transporter permease [Lentisphaerae bacterium]|nr:ABC transporter permease [Lentisphaerota bacterium]
MAFLTLWRRELAAHFLSPTAYVTLVIYLSLAGGTFCAGIVRQSGTTEPPLMQLFAALAFWMTFLIAVVCMRVFAEERRSGTIEMLRTAPLTDAAVVLSKYAGALTFVLLVMAPAAGYAFVLDALSPGIEGIDTGAWAAGCLYLVLLAGLCVAAGTLVSLLTRSPVVAALGCLAVIWLILLLGWLLEAVPGADRQLAERLSVTDQLGTFGRGVVDTRPAVLMLSATAVLLFVSIRVLESRRWR